MDTKSKLKNSLIRRIQKLSSDKLAEIAKILGKIEGQLKSKETTLDLAGSWKELDSSAFTELTEKLHSNRSDDRQTD